MSTNKTNTIHLVIRPKDTKVQGFTGHHFSVGATIKEAIVEVVSSKIDKKSENYIIGVRSEAQARKLLRIGKLKDGFKVKIERHEKLNQCRVTIRSKLLTGYSDEKLQKELTGQGVTTVKSIPPNNWIKIVTINLSSPPNYLTIGLMKIRTEKYYPMPLTCRKCQGLGHITEKCPNETKRCTNCSDVHNDPNCSRPPFCWNCGGTHRPLNKECPCYQQEKAIIRIQVNNNIRPRQAREVFRKKAGSYYIPLSKEPTMTVSSDEESDDGDKSPNEEPAGPSRTPTKLNDKDDEVVPQLKADALGHPSTYTPPPNETNEMNPDPEIHTIDITDDTSGDESVLVEDALGHPPVWPIPLLVPKKEKDLETIEIAETNDNDDQGDETVTPTPSPTPKPPKRFRKTRLSLNGTTDSAKKDPSRRESTE